METNQQFSCCNKEMRRFIFNRLQQTDNQKTLYTLRLISKSEQERVEKNIQTAKINFCCLEKFVASKFSERIKFLEVYLRKRQDSGPNHVYEGKYLSNTYLPYALNIYVKAYLGVMDYIRLEIYEPLTFQRLHIFNTLKINDLSLFVPGLCITGKYNVQIRDCEFIGITVKCKGNANVYVTGSKFIECSPSLRITECDSLYIDEISLDKCIDFGLLVKSVKEVINITNVRVFSCRGSGVVLDQNIAKFQLSNTIIKDCGTGILVCGCGEIQKTNIEGCSYGIGLYNGAIVHYAAVEFKHNKQDVKIYDDDAQFLQLENIQ